VRTIDVEVNLTAKPDRVWRYLTEPPLLSQWLMKTDLVPTQGHGFRFFSKPAPGWRGIVDCEVLDVQPEQKLSYSWQGDPSFRKTVVTWTLQPSSDGGTRLHLEHSGFQGIGGMALSTFILGPGWRRMLRKALPAQLRAE
jgi:uncharacterized protein YndB with AHSA1/START domain